MTCTSGSVKRYHYAWVKRSPHSSRYYWILAGIASIIVGILAGYSWWSDTALVGNIVEQQLTQSQAQMRILEKRVKALEAKVGVDTDSAVDDSGAKSY